MKRMYGEQRHFSVLRAEIESNDVDYDNWHGFNEPAFKKYDKSTATLLRQTHPSASSTTSSTTTSTSTVTTTTTSTTTKSTPIDNTTITEIPFSTENEDVTSTESTFETTVSEELPVSLSTSTTSLESSKTPQPQIFQGTTTELPTFRLKGV